jgi:hypothetical protein
MARTTGLEPATSDVTGLQSEIPISRISASEICEMAEEIQFRDWSVGDEPCTEPRKAGGRDFGHMRYLDHGGACTPENLQNGLR